MDRSRKTKESKTQRDTAALSTPRAPQGQALASGPQQAELSERLLSLRQEHGLSLTTLASRIGVTKGFLSLVERGLRAPSISTLMKLSHCYNLSIGALLDTKKTQDPKYSLVRQAERRKYAREGSLHGYRYEAIAFRKEHKHMEPFVVSMPMRIPRKFFQHKGDEMVYVMEGQVEVHLGEERILLNAGDCLYFDSTTPHRSRSIGVERATTLVVVSVPG